MTEIERFEVFAGQGVPLVDVHAGLYAEQLAVVRNLGFADDQLLVILSETAMKQTTKTLDFVVAWLGLEPFDFSALCLLYTSPSPRD